VEFQLDTGAAMSILSRRQWEKLGSPNLQTTNLKPVNYDGSNVATLGELSTKLSSTDSSVDAKFLVVESDRPYGLLGRNVIDCDRSKIATFSVSEFLPVIKGFTASISLKDSAKPLKFCKARVVPIHLKDTLDKELQLLEDQGIITPIQCAMQASPVVWVKKPNGRYRMCVDFKSTLNSNIQADSYPMPTAEEVFCKVGKACKFAKIDLKSAYSQIALDDNACMLSTINTHRGLYTLNRLQMGMKNASAIFQRCMEQILSNIPGVIIYQDDVMVCADSSRQLKKRLGQMKQRLKEFNVTLNTDKCIDECESLKFLGFIFSARGISPDPSLTNKISEAPAPTTTKELSSFLGLVNYYGRFIAGFSELCSPLYEAQAAKELKWTNECQRSFDSLKKKLTSFPVLQPFDKEKDSVLTVDASMRAIGAVLSQQGHPILFVSRKLSDAETRYSNIEREALAVLWACNRLEQFLVGKTFTIETDHKPLVYIFDPNSSIKVDISPRLLKFSLKLMRFDYAIKHVAGSQNVIADGLSRVFHQEPDLTPRVHFSETCIETETMALETDRDRFLQDLKRRIITGIWSRATRRELPFKKIAMQLSLDDDGCIRFGSRVVPPQSLFRRIFDIAHQSHNGIQSTCRLIEREFFWPNMRAYISDLVRSCQLCSKARFRALDTTHTWPSESEPWNRVHIDWAQHRSLGNVLVIADAFSGWLEAFVCSSRTTATVIDCLRALFARFGVPRLLVSDNAPEFSCSELNLWLQAIGCRLLHSPEYHPQSNGVAERAVRTIKDALKCFNPAKCSAQAYLHRLLFVHRNSASRGAKTPADLMIGRTVRCPILSSFQPMENVLYRPRKSEPPLLARFLHKQGANTSLVVHPHTGRAVTAHDAQLSSCPAEEQESAGALDSADLMTPNDESLGGSGEQRTLPARRRAPPDRFGNPVFY
jgi:hypothetical protein